MILYLYLYNTSCLGLLEFFFPVVFFDKRVL